MKANNILATIGNIPHVRINRLFGPGHEVWIKAEQANPGGSVKDRIALAMIEDAEKSGKLKPGGTIVEPTSGNTGVGLAMVAAVKGYKLILVMPESMSLERRRLMLAYGARFELTPRERGMPGAIERARELLTETPDAWMPQQFENLSGNGNIECTGFKLGSYHENLQKKNFDMVFSIEENHWKGETRHILYIKDIQFNS